MDGAFLDCLYVYSSRPESTLTGFRRPNVVLAKVRDSRETLECLQAPATISVWPSSPSPKFSVRLTDWLGRRLGKFFSARRQQTASSAV